MDAIAALTSRSSSAKLCAPAPSEAHFELIAQAMLRAPDHGLLRPWRYLRIEGDGLKALGEVFASAMRQRDPHVSDEALQRFHNMPLRAPLLVVGIACLQAHPKVPEHEQLLSAGCGLHAALLAAHALGYGGIWRTGDLAEDAYVRQALGLASNERISGFLYLGSLDGELRIKPTPEVTAHVAHWPLQS